jgi:Arc/MetJ-type ribon-helix-helix transcriptional regulator
MKRTTISLPDDLAAALEREARRRRLPVSHVVREGLEAHLGRGGERRRIPFAAVGRSGTQDTARNVDAVLEAEWDRDRDR